MCKVFPGGTKREPVKWEYEQSYSNARDSFAKIKLKENVRCSNVTHAGRHSGTLEAQLLGIPQDEIRHGGRWASGDAMINTYLSHVPVKFAIGMAGFRRKPFHLVRNEVPLTVKDHGDLMRKVSRLHTTVSRLSRFMDMQCNLWNYFMHDRRTAWYIIFF